MEGLLNHGIGQKALDLVHDFVMELLGGLDLNSVSRDMVLYQLESGGKGLRPLLALLATEAFGGDPMRAIPFAASVELLHNASLVHDDIEDKDETRRGRPAAWVAFSVEQAINLGDILFILAFHALGKIEVEEALKVFLIRETSKALMSLLDGQVLELVLRTKDMVSKEDYAQLAIKKTGALFGLVFVGACGLAGFRAEIDRLRALGDALGYLFQVRDDLLDLIGQKEGRRAGSDIEEGKISFPIVHFLGVAREEARLRILHFLRLPRSEKTRAEVEEVVEELLRASSLEATLEEYHLARARLLSCGQELPALKEILERVIEVLDKNVPKRLS